jgi:hypothetical protein
MRIISGDSGGLIKRAERQKFIFKESAIVSWQMILFYVLLNLLSTTPFFNSFFQNNSIRSIFLSKPFMKNGGDILVIGLIGYIIGLVFNYIDRTKIR